MHRDEPGAQRGRVTHASSHSVRNVVELEIEKHIAAARANLADDPGTGGREQLIANFIEPAAVAKIIDEVERVLRGRHIERDDWNGCHWRSGCGIRRSRLTPIP